MRKLSSTRARNSAGAVARTAVRAVVGAAEAATGTATEGSAARGRSSAASGNAIKGSATRGRSSAGQPADLAEHILATASGLFYREGVRAVGVDRVVAVAGIAKTSLYRHFPTKDDLIVAFLEREDREFWAQWDSVTAAHVGDPRGELDAQLRWIGERLARANYRGCPQINVAAEFAEIGHPSREVARSHMRELRRRLTVLAKGLRYAKPEHLAAQLALLVNGAFVSAELLSPAEAVDVLLDSAEALVARRP